MPSKIVKIALTIVWMLVVLILFSLLTTAQQLLLDDADWHPILYYGITGIKIALFTPLIFIWKARRDKILTTPLQLQTGPRHANRTTPVNTYHTYPSSASADSRISPPKIYTHPDETTTTRQPHAVSMSDVQDTDNDEIIYEEALNELEGEKINKGLWAKSFAKAGGDENRAKALYIASYVEQRKSRSIKEVSKPPSNRPTEDRYQDIIHSKSTANRNLITDEHISILERKRIATLSQDIKIGSLDLESYAFLAEKAGASFTWEGKFIKKNFVYRDANSSESFPYFINIRPWFLENVIPLIEQKYRTPNS